MGRRVVLSNVLRYFLFFILSILSGELFSVSVVNEEILGKRICSLYENFNFLKIEIDNEYADLKAGEQYWLAVDSHHEYLTLRTLNKAIVEIIIRNPDIETKRGIKVGDTLDRFKQAYPDAKKLTHYLDTGVPRTGLDFFVAGKNLEVNFSNNKTVHTIRIKE